MAVNDAPSPPPGVIRYRQLWVSDDGVTHLAERRFGGLETMDFTSTGGDAAMQYVRAFSSTDDFLLTSLVITQQVGENPWHHCPSPQFVVTLPAAGRLVVHQNVRWRGHHLLQGGCAVPGQLGRPPAGGARPQRRSAPRSAALERCAGRALQPARTGRGAKGVPCSRAGRVVRLLRSLFLLVLPDADGKDLIIGRRHTAETETRVEREAGRRVNRPPRAARAPLLCSQSHTSHAHHRPALAVTQATIAMEHGIGSSSCRQPHAHQT